MNKPGRTIDITIENPKPEDVDELNKLMRASKRYWGYPDEWMELWEDELTIAPETIRERDFYAGRKGEVLIFFYSISKLSEDRYDLADCWVAPGHIGEGYGMILFEHLKATLRSLNCRILVIESDPNAEGFYLHMGAVRVGEVKSKIEGRVLPILKYDVK